MEIYKRQNRINTVGLKKCDMHHFIPQKRTLHNSNWFELEGSCIRSSSNVIILARVVLNRKSVIGD